MLLSVMLRPMGTRKRDTPSRKCTKRVVDVPISYRFSTRSSVTTRLPSNLVPLEGISNQLVECADQENRVIKIHRPLHPRPHLHHPLEDHFVPFAILDRSTRKRPIKKQNLQEQLAVRTTPWTPTRAKAHYLAAWEPISIIQRDNLAAALVHHPSRRYSPWSMIKNSLLRQACPSRPTPINSNLNRHLKERLVHLLPNYIHFQPPPNSLH